MLSRALKYRAISDLLIRRFCQSLVRGPFSFGGTGITAQPHSTYLFAILITRRFTVTSQNEGRSSAVNERQKINGPIFVKVKER
jgi:hypothetical protein